MIQLTLADLFSKKYQVDKPIRLVELFGGIGSQAMSLRNIGANFEHYRLVEFDRFCIDSYNAIHGTDFKPTDIRDIKGKDLGIKETEKYCYIVCYSFPCQDISIAGAQKGYSKGEGTRSGLLWEVERLLKECEQLSNISYTTYGMPQILLMENVPNVHGKKNIEDFNLWLKFLKSLGYENYWQDLNASDYGIPQNRNRCFCISLLGNYTYDFPQKVKLDRTMDEFLEEPGTPDDKYYLKSERAEKLCKQVVVDYPNLFTLPC